MSNESSPTQGDQPRKETYKETAPPLSDYSPWKVGQPTDGIVWLYKSSADGLWRIIRDEDRALEEATGYPVNKLREYEQIGDHEYTEQGELRAIFVPPAEPDDTNNMRDGNSESKGRFKQLIEDINENPERHDVELSNQDRDETTEDIVEKIRNSRLDIIVHPENNEDVIIKEGDDIILTDRSGARRLGKEIQEKLIEGQPLFRHASVVRLTMDDPTNDNLTEGTIRIIAGPCKNGVSHAAYIEEKGDYVDVTCEVLERFRTDTVMTKRNLITWAKRKARQSDTIWN